MNITCKSCRIDFLQGSAGPCSGCGQDTYAQLKFCIACAVELDRCQACGAHAECGRTQKAVKTVQAARKVFEKARLAAEAKFDAQVANFRTDLDEWLRVNRESSAEYNDAIRPYQDAVEDAETARQRLRRTGIAANSPELIAANDEATAANVALHEAINRLQKTMQSAINEAKAKIGEDNIKVYGEAFNARQRSIRGALTRLDIVAERISGHLQVDHDYRKKLEKLKSQGH